MISRPSDIRLPTGNRPGFFHSVSLPTLLAATIGIALLAIRIRYAQQLAQVSSTLSPVLLAAGCVLLLYAIGQVVSRLFTLGPRRSSIMGRETVLLPREGIVFMFILLTLAAGALIGRSNLLMLVFALMAGPFVLNGVVVSMMLKKIEVSRLVPERTMAGQPMSVQIEIKNRKRFLSSRLIAVHDRISNAHETLDPGVLFVCVPPGQERRGTYTTHLMQRGVYSFGPIYIASRFPLGLGERGRTANVGHQVIVHPRIGILNSRWRHQLRQGTELVEGQRGRSGIFEDEFHRIREFRSGDNPRAIHWRTSARRNELMVREFEQNRDQNICVILDLSSAKTVASETERSAGDLRELAISFAGTVCCEHIRDTRDSRIGFFIAGQSVNAIDGPTTGATLDAIMDSLAGAQSGDTDHLDELLSASAAVRSTGARSLLITSRPDEAVDRIHKLSTSSDRSLVLSYETLNSIQVIKMDLETLTECFTLTDLAGRGKPQNSATSVERSRNQLPNVVAAEAV